MIIVQVISNDVPVLHVQCAPSAPDKSLQINPDELGSSDTCGQKRKRQTGKWKKNILKLLTM